MRANNAFFKRGFRQESPQLKIDPQKIDVFEIESVNYRSVENRPQREVDYALFEENKWIKTGKITIFFTPYGCPKKFLVLFPLLARRIRK